MTGVAVRRYRPEDAEALATLYRRSVEELGPRDYTAEQVAAWLTLAPPAARLDACMVAGRLRLVAHDIGDRPLGFVDLEADGHIDFLFCAPEAAGQGVAPALLDELERIARARGTVRLYSEASEAARRLFLKRGFTVLHRRDLTVAGVAIHNYAVEKRLTGQS